MGIIRAAIDAVKGGLGDQWLESIESAPMGPTTVFCPGVVKSTNNGRGSNLYGSSNIISNGSRVHIYDNQMMILVDGGKIVDYCAEPGYFTVNNSSAPSLLNGQFGDTLKESFERVKFGGVSYQAQRVFFINLAEIRGIPFGTSNPIQYFDNFYNAELFLKVHGTYSFKIVDPFKFYSEVISKDIVLNNQSLDFKNIKSQFSNEFNQALCSAISQYSVDGYRVSHVTAMSDKFGEYMSDALDEDWRNLRGFEIVRAAIDAPIAYDDESQKLINMRNKGAMMSDAAVQQGYVAANISEGLKDAGSNANGSMAGFMGMGMGMNMGGNVMGGYMQNPHYNNQQPMQQNGYAQQQPMQQNGYAQQQPMQQNGYAPQQPDPQQQPAQQTAPVVDTASDTKSADSWVCECGTENTGKFCHECGSKRPEMPKKRFCQNCGYELKPSTKFCPECGTKAE